MLSCIGSCAGSDDAGTVRWFKNSGTTTVPKFAEATGSGSPFSQIEPTALGLLRGSQQNLYMDCFDFDGDGDHDCVFMTKSDSGQTQSGIYDIERAKWFPNVGTSYVPQFTEVNRAVTLSSAFTAFLNISSPTAYDPSQNDGNLMYPKAACFDVDGDGDIECGLPPPPFIVVSQPRPAG